MGREHIEIEVDGHVGWLWMNRPDKRNALSADMWPDIPDAARELASDERIRAIVVAGRGVSFCSGIDLALLASLQPSGGSHAAHSRQVRRDILRLQDTMSVFASIDVPTIAAIHGACLGGGIDLITACDIRFAAPDAVFGVRETPMGLVADVGTMQRLPRIIGPGHVAELVFTGRDFDATEAERVGLVNRVVEDVHAHAAEVAAEIARNSPLVVQGAKELLRLQEEMSTEAALDHMALWNAAFIHSNDLMESMAAYLEKRPPDYTGT